MGRNKEFLKRFRFEKSKEFFDDQFCQIMIGLQINKILSNFESPTSQLGKKSNNKMIKAKFKVLSKIKTESYDSKNQKPTFGYQLNAFPVYAGSEENDQYFNATPGGKLELLTLNKAAADQLEPGDEFYMTLEKIEK